MPRLCASAFVQGNDGFIIPDSKIDNMPKAWKRSVLNYCVGDNSTSRLRSPGLWGVCVGLTYIIFTPSFEYNYKLTIGSKYTHVFSLLDTSCLGIKKLLVDYKVIQI